MAMEATEEERTSALVSSALHMYDRIGGGGEGGGGSENDNGSSSAGSGGGGNIGEAASTSRDNNAARDGAPSLEELKQLSLSCVSAERMAEIAAAAISAVRSEGRAEVASSSGGGSHVAATATPQSLPERGGQARTTTPGADPVTDWICHSCSASNAGDRKRCIAVVDDATGKQCLAWRGGKHPTSPKPKQSRHPYSRSATTSTPRMCVPGASLSAPSNNEAADLGDAGGSSLSLAETDAGAEGKGEQGIGDECTKDVVALEKDDDAVDAEGTNARDDEDKNSEEDGNDEAADESGNTSSSAGADADRGSMREEDYEEEEDPPSSSAAAEDNDHGDLEDDEKDDTDDPPYPPPAKFESRKRAYARDEATGMLYPALVRRAMHGPKNRQVTMHQLMAKDKNEKKKSRTDGEGDDKGKDEEGNDEADANDNEDEDEEDEDDWDPDDPKNNCWHYYVHYMGWNVKWDRWVEEESLYRDNERTRILASKLEKEIKAITAKKKKGQKASQRQVIEAQRRMMRLEEEHREEERREQEKEERRKRGEVVSDDEPEGGEGDSGNGNTNESSGGNERNPEANDADQEKRGGDIDPTTSALAVETKEAEAAGNGEEPADDIATGRKKKTPRRFTASAIEKERKLRERDLESKRRQCHAEKILLPFSLKKVLVEEWEIITQCGMVTDLPARVTVADALKRYLQTKVEMLRGRQGSEKGNDDMEMEDRKESVEGVDDDDLHTSGGSNDNGKDDQENAKGDEGDGILQDALAGTASKEVQEWIDMVDGVALFFDQALPVQLLYRQENDQHAVLVRRLKEEAEEALSNAENDDVAIDEEENSPTVDGGATKSPFHTSADADSAKPRGLSDFYGCEHLLRLFVRFPALLAEASSISEAEKRKILAKMGDLVRFLQKHQGEFFLASYRRPNTEEEAISRRKRGRRRRTSVPEQDDSATAETDDGDVGRKRAKISPPHSSTVDRQEVAAAIAALNESMGRKYNNAAALAAANLRGASRPRNSSAFTTQVNYGGRSRYIGQFRTFEEAVLAHEIAREVLESDNKTPSEIRAQSSDATDAVLITAREAVKAAFACVKET